MKQLEYTIEPITVNGIKVSRVIIDDHYKEKHSDHMSDNLILDLVWLLEKDAIYIGIINAYRDKRRK